MELDTGRRYFILDIHPDDFFYEFRRELVGQEIEILYGRSSRLADDEYIYCEASFPTPIVAENIIIEHIVFHAVMLGDLEDVINERTSKTQAS